MSPAGQNSNKKTAPARRTVWAEFQEILSLKTLHGATSLTPLQARRFNAIRPHSLTRVPRIGYFYNLSLPQHLSSVTKLKSQKPQSFEQALAEIESIVAAMEAGQLPLEQSLAAYKRGAELLQYCQAQLREAQQQVKVLEAGTLQNFSGDNGNE